MSIPRFGGQVGWVDHAAVATLVRWLNMPAGQFMVEVDGQRDTQTEPDLVTQLAPLLRARQDFDKRDVAYLEEVIRATVRHVQAAREEDR